MSTPTLSTILGDIKSFLVGGFINLPLTIVGTLLILSLMTANYAMLFMVIGILVGVPALWFVMHMLAEFVGMSLNMPALFSIKKTDLSSLIGPYPIRQVTEGAVYTTASMWSGMMMFILGYLLYNAIDLYRIETVYPANMSETTKKMIDEGTSNRKSQAIVSILVITIITVGILLYRLVNGLEPLLSGGIGMILFGLAGAGWYSVLSSSMDGRISDVFGIANRILKPTAMLDQPLACLPQGQSTN